MTIYSSSLVINAHDKAILSEFWKKETNWTSDRFDWFYRDNGYGISQTTMLSLADGDGIVGCSSFFVRSFNVGGLSLLGAVNCDILVNQNHRTLGPALMLIKNLLQSYPGSNVKFLMAFPNRKSKPVFMRCGYKELGKSYRWSKVLRFEKKLEDKVGVKLVAKMVGFVIDSMVKLLSKEFLHKFKLPSDRCYLIPATVDEWQEKGEADVHADVSIYGRRAGDYLKWRYADSADALSYSILSIRKKGREIGYVVYSLGDGVVSLHDIPPLSLAEFESVLVAFFGHARSLKAESISIGFLGDEKYQNILKKLYFIKREPRSVMLHCDDKILLSQLMDEQKWYLMDGDVDI